MSISLASIQRGKRLLPPKVTLYGVGGIGKTTWASGAPKPIFMFTEEGQGTLDLASFPTIKVWPDLIEAIGVLYKEAHDFETAVIDSLDFAEPLLWKHTAERHGKKDIEEFGYGKGYLYAADEFRVLLDGLDALRNDRGMSIVLIGHSETKKFESPDSATYDRYQLRLHSRLANLVHDWSDALLFANYEVAVVSEKEGFNRERKRATGKGTRVLYTEERPSFWAKNRYGLPPKIGMSWAEFQSAMVQDETPPGANPDEQEPQPKQGKK